MIIVLIFAHFIESIVQLVNKNRKIHGRDQLLGLLDVNETQKGKFKIYPHIDKTNIIFDLYESMLSNDALNIMPTMDNIYLKDFSVKFYFEQLEAIDEFKKENIGEMISHISMRDSEWAIEKFKIIYYHRNPLSMIFNKAINIIVNKLKIKDNTDEIKKIYKEKIQNEFEKAIYDKLMVTDNGETINIEDESYKEKFEVNLREKLRKKLEKITELKTFGETKKKEELEELGKAIDNYFSKEKIEYIKSDNTDKKDKTIVEDKKEEHYEIIQMATLYTTLKGMPGVVKKEALDKLEKDINNYFLEEKNTTAKNYDTYIKEEKEEYYEIVNIAIMYTALKEISNVGKYEQEYFRYFQEWHNKLKDIEPYKSWYEQQKSSPLTLILENSTNV